METTPKSRPWFVAIPVVLLLIMLMVPFMRRLIVSQVRLVFRAPHAYAWAVREQGVSTDDLPDCDPGEEQQALQAVATAHPQDYQIQLAYSLTAEWSHAENSPDDRVKRLDALAGQFPAHATLYAHMLRYETEREVKIRRRGEYEHFVNQVSTEDVKLSPDEMDKKPEVKAQDEFERYGIAGENLEPDNAYFSMMRAVGLFASHDDKVAVACIKSAAAKHQWEDHMSDELEADWRLGSMAFGEHNAALRAAIQGGVGSPHLEQLAAVGRTAAALAIAMETQGRGQEGVELRIAMARCGSIMRSKAHTIAAAITGADIVYQQIYRPGGAPLIVEDVNYSTAQREQQRLDAYFNYLKKYGYASEAVWMQQELKTDGLVRDIQKGAASASLSPYGKHGLRVTTWWMMDCVLLMNIAFLLAVLLIVLPFTIRKKVQTSSIVLVLLGAYALELAAASVSQWGQAMMSLRSVFMHWIEQNGGVESGKKLTNLTDRVFDPGNLHLVVVLLAIASSVLLFVLLYRSSRKTNIVFVDTIRLEIVHYGALLTCLLMIGYWAALTKTSIHDTQLHAELDQVMLNEGRFDAPLIGKQWPN